MNTRRLLFIAIILNIVLVAGLVWVWSSRRPVSPVSASPQTAEHPPMEGFTPKAETPVTLPLTPVQLTPERMQSIGVRTGKAQFANLKTEIRATGTIEVDERRTAYVQTRYPGWIRSVLVNATYQFVKQGQPLFTIYSPEVAASEQEYLLARNNLAKLSQSTLQEVSSGADQLLQSSRARLKQWNLSEADIEKLDASGKPSSEFTFNSPVSGYVLERMALPNAFVQPEMKLYTVADLSSVWAYAQVFQEDAGKFKPGDAAEISVDAYPGRIFHAHVEQIVPQVDPTTRMLRVRMDVSNPGLLLKPGMFVNIQLHGPASRQIVIPSSAVLHSGSRDLVFMDHGNGLLEPREISIGTVSGDQVSIRSGLKAGDVVVTSASFLIDSESQLQAAAGAFSPSSPLANVAPSQSEAGNAELTTNPSPPQKGKNEVRVRITDAKGGPVENAQVTVKFYLPAMTSMGMPAMNADATLESRGGGFYAGQVELGSGGTWQITVTAQLQGKPLVNKRLNLSATGGM